MRTDRLLSPGRPTWIDEPFRGFSLNLEYQVSPETVSYCFQQSLNSELGGAVKWSNNSDHSYH